MVSALQATPTRDVPGVHSVCPQPQLLNKVEWSRPPAELPKPSHAPPRPRPSAPHPIGWAGHAGAASCHWPAPAGEVGPERQGLRCVVIRRRLEDTIKMAAVSGLVRRPLEQVHSGTRDPCAIPAHPSFPLSVLFIFPPGLRAAEEALPPDSVSGAAGNWLGR